MRSLIPKKFHNRCSHEGISLSLIEFHNFADLFESYVILLCNKKIKNSLIKIIPNILSQKIITTIYIDDHEYSVYYISATNIIVSDDIRKL